MEQDTDTNNYQALKAESYQMQKLTKAMQLVSIISQTPSTRILCELCKTEDLKFFWWILGEVNKHLAKCFFVLFLRSTIKGVELNCEDLFKNKSNKKIISTRNIDLYQLEAERLLREWQLIESIFPDFIAERPDIPFQTDLSFFGKVFEAQAFEEFERRGSNCYEIDIPSRSRYFGKVLELTKNRTTEEESQELLSDSQVYRHPLREEILFFASQQNSSYQKQLCALQTNYNYYASTILESYKAPNRKCSVGNSKNNRIKTEVWIKGHRYTRGRGKVEAVPYLEELKLELGEQALQEIQLALQYLIQNPSLV